MHFEIENLKGCAASLRNLSGKLMKTLEVTLNSSQLMDVNEAQRICTKIMIAAIERDLGSFTFTVLWDDELHQFKPKVRYRPEGRNGAKRYKKSHGGSSATSESMVATNRSLDASRGIKPMNRTATSDRRGAK